MENSITKSRKIDGIFAFSTAEGSKAFFRSIHSLNSFSFLLVACSHKEKDIAKKSVIFFNSFIRSYSTEIDFNDIDKKRVGSEEEKLNNSDWKKKSNRTLICFKSHEERNGELLYRSLK